VWVATPRIGILWTPGYMSGCYRAAPEIVIEILSPGASNERRDWHVKRNLYATRGVGEYWIVDTENRSVEVHRRDEAGNLASETNFRQNDELTSGFLPGFAVQVDALFKSKPVIIGCGETESTLGIDIARHPDCVRLLRCTRANALTH
jgi:hypothetical protein